MNRAFLQTLALLLVCSSAAAQTDVVIRGVPEGTHYLKVVVVNGKATVVPMANVASPFGGVPPITTPPPIGQPPVFGNTLQARAMQLTQAALAQPGATVDTAVAMQRLLAGVDRDDGSHAAGIIDRVNDGQIAPRDAVAVLSLGMDLVFVGGQGVAGRSDGAQWANWRTDLKFELAKLNLQNNSQATGALREVEAGIKAAVEQHFATDPNRAKAIDIAMILKLIEMILSILASLRGG